MSERLDLTLIMTWMMLVVTGLVMVVSATAALAGGPTFYLTKLVLFTGIAVGVVAVLASVPLRLWEVVHKPCILLAIAMCVVVLIPGVSEDGEGQQTVDRSRVLPTPTRGIGQVAGGGLHRGLRRARRRPPRQ